MVRASAWPDLLHFFLCLVLHSSSSVQALPKTRTIDDTFGDLANPDIQTPIYNGNWIARRGSECSNSTGCSDIVPNNANLIVNGTWHEALHSPTQPEPSTLHLSFNELIPGTALSVFCILPARTIIRGGGTSNIVWPLYLNFLLDSQPAESFNRTPDQLTDSFQYNVSVFSRDNLENKAHTFIIALNDPLNDSFVLFDYASYVYDDDTVKAKFKASLVGYIFVGLASGMGFLMFIWYRVPGPWLYSLLDFCISISELIDLIARLIIRLIISPITLPINALRRRRYLKSRLLDALKATEYSYRFNSPAQPSYLELLGDTRSQYIYGVLSDWAHTRLPKKGSAGAGIYWLQGSESSWRSAVAQKLAKECEEKELLSTFFFSTEDPNRNTPRYLTLAIAHEMMATSSFGTRNSVFQALHVQQDMVLIAPVEIQFKTLVVAAYSDWRNKLYNTFRFPLRTMTASSTLIILDGLDECSSVKEQQRVLSLVLIAMGKKLPIRFLISSRPTQHLRQQFDKPELRRHTKIISLDSDSNTPLATRNTETVTFRLPDESSSIV